MYKHSEKFERYWATLRGKPAFWLQQGRIKEIGKKISAAKKGIKFSPEHIRKLSLALKGRISPMKGKRHTEKAKRLVSLHNGRIWLGKKRPDISEKLRIANTGKKHSVVTRQKISEFMKENPRPKEFYRRIGLKSLLKQWEFKETSIEKIVYGFLKSKGIIFEKQKLINGKFLVDVYIPDLNLVIECDGDYWHSLGRVKNRDKTKNAYLTKCGYGLLRLKEHEIKNNNFIQILKERLVQ